jgi:hypothetical protein
MVIDATGHGLGQSTESIVGTITGAQTPAVPGTSITLLNTGIGESKVGKFGAMGNYQFLELLPGMSKVTVEASGFKQPVRSGTGVTDAAMMEPNSDRLSLEKV